MSILSFSLLDNESVPFNKMTPVSSKAKEKISSVKIFSNSFSKEPDSTSTLPCASEPNSSLAFNII